MGDAGRKSLERFARNETVRAEILRGSLHAAGDVHRVAQGAVLELQGRAGVADAATPELTRAERAAKPARVAKPEPAISQMGFDF